jgi:hypothetical protein
MQFSIRLNKVWLFARLNVEEIKRSACYVRTPTDGNEKTPGEKIRGFNVISQAKMISGLVVAIFPPACASRVRRHHG